MIPIFIAVLGAILTIAAAIYQYSNEKKAELEAEDAKSEAKNFNERLIKSQIDLIEEQKNAKNDAELATKEIIRLNQELSRNTSDILAKSEIASKTQQETINFILGTGSPQISFYGKAINVYSPVLHNSSMYPIYDLTIDIMDFDKIINCKSKESNGIVYMSQACVKKSTIAFGPTFIAPGARKMLDPVAILVSNELVHLSIQTISRTKITQYLCILNITTPEIKYCIRQYDTSQGKKLINQENHNLRIDDDNYWNEKFFANKEIHIGPE